MAALHLITHRQALGHCLTVAGDTDALLLLGDAAGAAPEAFRGRVFVLRDDLPAGAEADLPAACTAIGYPDFVRLVTEHGPIVSWR